MEKEIIELYNEIVKARDNSYKWISPKDLAILLYKELGYRNCKDKVVLSKEEYEVLVDIKNLKTKVKEALNINPIEEIVQIEREACKETAEKILIKGKQLIEKWLSKDDEKVGFLFDFEEFIKELGVEIKE